MRLCPPKAYTYMYLREKQSITRETPGLEREGTAASELLLGLLRRQPVTPLCQ